MQAWNDTPGILDVATRTSIASGNWTAAIWDGAVPTAADDAVLNHLVTGDATTLVCRDCTINAGGTYRASRSVNSTLTIGRNLVVAGGILDLGTFNDRIPANVQTRLLWNIVGLEAGYVGGDTEVPLATDPGLWVIGNGQVFAHGAIKDTWTKIVTAPIGVGATSGAISGIYTQGWAPGDEIVFSDTHLRLSNSDNQDEVRTLSTISGVVGDASRTITWASGLSFAHEYLAVPVWTDPFGDAWNEVLAGEVSNLTKNVILDTSTGTNTDAPHFMVLDNGKVYLEDVRIDHFSPVSTRNPMGRYALHIHQQFEGSRGSYIRRCIVANTKGGGVFVHESHGVTGEDNVFYNVARVFSTGEQVSTALNLEVTVTPPSRGPDIIPAISANDFRWERGLSMRTGTTAGSDTRSAAFWAGVGAFNASFLGCVASGHSGGSDSAGFLWPEGAANSFQQTHAPRCESHSNWPHGFFLHQNSGHVAPMQVMVDWIAWRNGRHGMQEGAYVSGFHTHQFRGIENGAAQLIHSVIGRQVTTFLADPRNLAGAFGVRILRYVLDSVVDSYYRDGVVRNVASGQTAVGHDPTGGVAGSLIFAQFARVTWSNISGTLLLFGPGPPPPVGSHLRIRNATGLASLGHGTDFTIYRQDDPANPGVFAANVNGDVDTPDTANTVPLTPRCFLTISTGDDGLEPVANAQGQRIVTLTVATRDATAFARPDAHVVDFYLDNDSQLLASVVPDASGVATFQYNVAAFPHRRPYFFARARYTSGPNASVEGTASRVLRVRRAIGASQVDPTAPTLTSLTNPSTGVLRWAWGDVANEVSYDLETSPDNNNWTVRGTAGSNSITADWTAATPGATYWGRVVAIGPTGNRFPSNSIQRTLAVAVPAAPLNPRAANVTTTTFDVQFEDNSGGGDDDETTWHARVRTPPTTGTYEATINQATATGAGTGSTVTIAITGRTASTQYEVEVWASNASGESTRQTFTITTNAAPPPNPGTPTINSAVAISPTQIDATWTNVADEQGYDLESSPAGAGTWTVRRTFSADETSGSWLTAVPNTAYDIRVVAFSGAVRAASGSIAATTPAAIPAAPISPRVADIGTGTANFIVTDNSGAAGDPETAFEAQYRDETDPGNPSAYVSLSNAASQPGTGTEITFALSGLTAGRTYRARSRAINATGNSAYAETTFTTQPPAPPGPVGGSGRADGRFGSYLRALVVGRRKFWSS